MSPETAELRELQEERTEVQHELDRTREKRQRLRRSREEIAEQIERLQEEAKAKAEARKFIPGEEGEQAPVESLEDELEEEKEKLAGVYEREDELEEKKARLDEEIDEVAGELLGEAVRDEAEEVEYVRGRAWHGLRRKWVIERKHLPDADVAEAGGWEEPDTVRHIYQQPDAATMYEVVTNGGQQREAQA